MIPLVVRAAIGGFGGPSYSIEWTGAHVIYERWEYDERTAWAKTVPTDRDWARFFAKCDELGVWGWQQVYDSSAVDGTSWEIEIESEFASVHSSGNQAFPPDGDSEVSQEFTVFCRALSNLAGGTPFM